MSTYGYLVHHGIKGQKWGVKNGPPYPLDYSDHNSAERKSNSKTSLSKYNNHNDTKKSSGKSSGSSSSGESSYEKSKIRTYIGNKTGHYKRNDNNTSLPKNDKAAKKAGWRKLSAKESAMHQFNKSGGVNNSKWVSPDGHKEVVFTDKGRKQHITKDPRDMGTYNYYDPQENPLGHTIADVLPYVFLGNSADDPTSTYDRLSESVKNFMNKSTNELDNASKEVGKQITDAIDKNTPVKDFIDRTKVVYKNEIDTYKNKKDAKSEMKEAKKEQKEAAKEYLKTQNKLAIKYALADSKYSTREAALNAIMAGTGTMPLKYATNVAARGTQLYANYAFNKGRKAAGKEPLSVTEFDELLGKRNGVNPFNNPMPFTRNEAIYKEAKSNKHKELLEKSNSDYESLQTAKANYKEKKQAYKDAKEERNLAIAWTTNKAKYKYLTAETPEDKKKYKNRLKAEDALTKYVALKGGKKLAKKAVGLGTKGVIAGLILSK